MRATRRDVLVRGVSVMALAATAGPAALADNGDIAAAVEALRQAMIAADKAKLLALAHDQLSYSHSSGKTETKAEYAEAIASRKSVFKSITLTDHKNTVVGDNAIARHTFAAEVDRGGGKVDAVKIGVLQVWKKDATGWKLLARQGYKL